MRRAGARGVQHDCPTIHGPVPPARRRYSRIFRRPAAVIAAANPHDLHRARRAVRGASSTPITIIYGLQSDRSRRLLVRTGSMSSPDIIAMIGITC